MRKGSSIKTTGSLVRKRIEVIMNALKCSIHVRAGVITGEPIPEFTRSWEFTQADLDKRLVYVDQSGAAMNYAMSLQNPAKINWVKLEWVWY